MKKVSLLLAVLLALVGLSALAEPALAQKVFEVQNGEFLGNTNLFAFRNEGFGLQGIMGPDGSEVLPPTYYNMQSNNVWGFIETVGEDRLNGTGVIDAQGKVLIPFEYGAVDVLSDEWITAVTLKESTQDNYDYQAMFGGYGSGYYLIDEHIFFNMKTGEAVGKMPRGDFEMAYAYDGFLVVKDMQGTYTVYDSAFQPVGTTNSISSGYVFAKNGDQWDVKRAGDEQLLFSTPYDVSGFGRDDNTFRIVSQGKQGRLDLTGKVLVPPEYDSVVSSDGEYFRVRPDREGKMGLVDAAGNPVGEFKYDDIPVYHARGTTVGNNALTFVRGCATVELDGKMGYINEQGEETLPPTYAKDAVEINGNTLLFADATGKKTLVAADGTVTELPYPKVERIQNGQDGRLYLATNDADQVGVIGWHGEVVVPFGNYAGYGVVSSTDGSTLAVKNKDTGLLEVYSVPQNQ